jgi:putative lipoic acid-binding regulatory protein
LHRNGESSQRDVNDILPIRSPCGKIHTHEGYRQNVDEYALHHTSAKFSHGSSGECDEALPEILLREKQVRGDTLILRRPMRTSLTTFTFPCTFPLKVMGQNNEAFQTSVMAIFQKHLHPAPVVYTSRPSAGGKYLSLTATFTAQSREQLDALYRELNAHELVVMTL